MIRFFLLLILQISLFAVDFDCIVIGTSPFSLLEALYQSHSGKKVLIVEESPVCGGAWQSIELFGIPHADLGCHMVGQDLQIKEFLEEYVGCKTVSLDNPSEPFQAGKCKLGWYFPNGCFELIDNLLKLIAATDITLYTNCKAEKALFDLEKKEVLVQTKEKNYTAHKLIATPVSHLDLAQFDSPKAKSKFHHLYLLIQDPTPPRFSYYSPGVSGASRMMNLTHFVDLASTGRQLLVIQTHQEADLTKGQFFLDALIEKGLFDKSAYILQSECRIYEMGTFYQNNLEKLGAKHLVDVLQTGHIQALSKYIEKWKQVLEKFDETRHNAN